MKYYTALLLLSTMASSSAFSIVTPVTTMPRYVTTHRTGKNAPLSALIYGWDGKEEESSSYETTAGTDDFSGATCTDAGVAVAEILSRDQDRMGSLARLAVAFSPPERALSLKDLEHVEVICVRGDSIEIQAMICEDGGCVSLSVPVKFPRECGSDAEWLEGCVMRNLEDLDVEAESTLLLKQEYGNDDDVDLEELCQLNQKVQYPSWWIPPECNADLVEECDKIRRLLNEEEFQNEIVALAQVGLRHAGEGDSYVVRKARVAAVGPAGICLKIGAAIYLNNQEDLHFLDVVYPFGGEPLQDIESLKAAVLGAIAAAEDQRPSHVYEGR